MRDKREFPCSLLLSYMIVPHPSSIPQLQNSREIRLSTMAIGNLKTDVDTEVPWHEAALLVYQAAAYGQDDITFEKESKVEGDSAREDIRGCFQGTPYAPQEGKRSVQKATSTSNGIEQNKGPIAKASDNLFILVFLIGPDGSMLFFPFISFTR